MTPRDVSRVLRYTVLLLVLNAVVLESFAEPRRRAVKRPAKPVLTFTSSTRYLTAGTSTALDPGRVAAMTIELELFQTGDVNGYGAPFTRVHDGHPAYNMAIEATGPGEDFVYFAYRDAIEGRILVADEPKPLSRRSWVHAALLLDGAQVRAYLDGVLYATAPMSGMPGLDESSEPLRIGPGFAGAIRNVRVWHRALTEQEIAGIARGQRPTSLDALAAWWPLSDGEGQTLQDLGPNNIAMVLGEHSQPDSSDPIWLDGGRLGEGPYWELRYLPRSQAPSGGSGNALVVEAPPGHLPHFIVMGHVSYEEHLVCGFPYFQGIDKQPGTAFRNLGNELFTEDPTLIEFQMAGQEFRYLVGDLTNDGMQDLFIVDTGIEYPFTHLDCGDPGVDFGDFSYGQNRLLVAQPSGGLREETNERLPKRIAYDHAHAIGDFDGDGDLDIYLGGRNNLDPEGCQPQDWTTGAPCPVILINDGAGHFTEDFTRLPLSVATHRNELGESRFYTAGQSIDADLDGDQDLVLGGWSLGLSEPYDLLLLNDGTGHFTHGPPGAVPHREPEEGRPGGNATFYMASADFNRDGWPDLLSVQYKGTHLYINQKDGTFVPDEDALPDELADELGYCNVADLNGDGAPDFYCFQHLNSEPEYGLSMGLYYNRGDGTFEKMPPIDDIPDGAWVYAVDADGDGDLDLMGNLPYLWIAYQRKPYVPGPKD